jgi:hypothetical protein
MQAYQQRIAPARRRNPGRLQQASIPRLFSQTQTMHQWVLGVNAKNF